MRGMDIEDIKRKYMSFMEQHSKEKGYDLNIETTFIHLSEEVGEVAQQLINKKMRKDLYSDDNLREEIIDVIIEAIVLATVAGVDDLSGAIDGKIEKLFERHKFKKCK
jgi:NTP pyrophosphatase (non-canonical NTP hydrolase)